MKKICFAIGLTLGLTACSNRFLDISPNGSVTDDAVWASASSTKMFINDDYDQTLTGPLYSFTGFNGSYSFDYFATDDMAENNIAWNELNFTASNAPFERWTAGYTNIRKSNLGLEKVAASTALTDSEKDRFTGDLHFLRGLQYLELFRFYGGVPLITKPLDRNGDEDIAYPRNTPEETLQFIVSEFDLAAEKLPVTVDPAEYGRATRGAALGMKAVALLHGAGTVDPKYYADAAAAARVFIDGDLKDRYALFGRTETDPLKKREAFINLFLEPHEGNEEVIFDVQYAYPYKFQQGFQTIAAPGVPGPGNAYGWGRSAPTQNLVDAFEMADGTPFDWKNPAEAAHPYDNRDQRLYGTILYDNEMWKGAPLSLSSNRFDNGVEVTNNLPNGLFSTKSEATKTGYYMRKHQNEPVVCGPTNRAGLGDGGNMIILRLAEILLTYAEAQNETSGPDATVYDAINRIRDRAGQPGLPAGLSQQQMRDRIRNERRVELALECKRYFDIIRWKIGDLVLNQPIMGMNVKYVKDAGTSAITPTYNPFVVLNKKFSAPRNYLMPVPQSAINRNAKLLPNNPGW